MTGFFNPHSFESGGGELPKRIPQCGRCGLSKKCHTPKMKVSGSGKVPILIIGEAPTEEDDDGGTPFVGESGWFLRDILRDMGFDFEDMWSTNAVICHPPHDKVGYQMLVDCRPNLIKTISTLNPKVIITLGMPPLNSLLTGIWAKDIGTIGKWVGWNIPVKEYKSWMCPTYSLSHVFEQERNVILRNEFKKHLKQALSLLKKPLPSETLDYLKDKVEVILNPREAKNRINDLSKKEGILAFDYETTGLKPDSKKQKIVSVSFCLNGVDTFACMMTPEVKEPLIKTLINPDLKKVASNLKFEDRWTKVKLGYSVRRWYWDTMLIAHTLDNRSGITSVKFQSFIYFGIGDYDSHISPYLKAIGGNGLNRIELLDPKDLLIYNGLDSLLEYMVMKKQKEIIRKCQKSQ